MKNKELFTLNPDENNLMNDGVVEINTAKDDQGLKIIRHELKTFVCEGEYQSGIYRILDTYLKHFDQPKQPAVWVSGFFGSGKSHLVKMLGYFWEDFTFPNGDSSRKIKPLPSDVNELIVELDRKQKLHGRLAISGTLKDFPSSDIRYSFLQLLLSSLGLPPQYHHFKFIYWTKKEGIYNDLKVLIESKGTTLKKEYENLFVSSILAKAILQLKPEFAQNEADVKKYFAANFKRIESVSREQLISTIKDEALPLTYGDKIPCTVIVLDEVQQFIGQDGNKTIDIQNLAQDICSNFNGKFLLIGTGQNSLAETPQLQPLQDRFTVKVSLSDTDVETVTRKTVLEKKASVLSDLNKKLEDSLGEISRNMAGTEFGYKTEDKKNLAADYPILPSTRKFWKKILQVIDTAGTSGQLRSQLRIIDESIKRVANAEFGTVVPADFVFDQKQQQLLMNALLLNETNNLITDRKSKEGDTKLEGRILSIVFLIDHLPKDMAGGRIKSDENTIADLLLDNLNEASDKFRNKIKELVKKLVEEKILMPVNDEFKLQTKVGAEWEQEFMSQVIKLQNSGDDQIQRLRKEKIIGFFNEKTKTINILQGVSKQKREFDIWDKQDRPNTESKLNLWIRDGWFENEGNVMNEIRAEGADSCLSYVFVKKHRDQDLRGEIIKYLAADLTLQAKGIPSSPEGEQAKKSMETRKGLAMHSVKELSETICKEGVVYLAGGNKVDSGSIGENAKEALEAIADRQFPEFKAKGDYKDWDKALAKAVGGDPDALKKINWDKDAKDHPVGLEILRFIGNQSKTGKEVRNQFMKAPYGWSQDAIDTMLLMLKLTEHISSSEPNLNQAKINGATFKKEIHTLSAPEKIKLRKLYQDANINCKPGEEFLHSNTFLNKLTDLAESISGDAPKPEPINTNFLKEILNLDGNERLLRILEEQEDLKAKLKDWNKKSELIKDREPNWSLLYSLYGFLPSAAEYDELIKETEAILNDRLLLNEPDLIRPLLTRVGDVLKNLLLDSKKKYNALYDELMTGLQSNPYFSKLEPDQKHSILAKHQILAKPEVKSVDGKELLNQLQKASLDTWQTKVAALPGQFQSALEDAIRLSDPKSETYTTPKTTITSEEDLEKYITQVKSELLELLKKSKSIIIR